MGRHFATYEDIFKAAGLQGIISVTRNSFTQFKIFFFYHTYIIFVDIKRYKSADGQSVVDP